MDLQIVHNAMMTKAASHQKQAISDIPTEWKKYLTEEERQSTADAIYRFQETGATAGEKAGLILNAIPNAVAGPIGMISAGFTPSYTTEDMKALGNDEDFSTKASWIPGYLHYKAVKTQAAIDRIFKKVRERRAAERANGGAPTAKTAAKKPKAEEVDLGDGWSYSCSTPEDYTVANRIKANSRVMNFGDALGDAAPVALLAAAMGGLGSLALSRGNFAAAGIGAAASGLGTLAFNGLSNAGKRKMSVADAIDQELQNA